MSKYCLYTCLIGNYKYDIDILFYFLKSLREGGQYSGDVFILTDKKEECFEKLKIFDIKIVFINKNDFVIKDKIIDKSFCSLFPYGCFFKSFIYKHVDIFKYDLIIYSDPDIVFGENIEKLFIYNKEQIYITKGKFKITNEYYLNHQMINYFNISIDNKIEQVGGVNSGLFYSSPSYFLHFLHFFEECYYNIKSEEFKNIGHKKWCGLMDQNIINYMFYTNMVNFHKIDNNYYTYKPWEKQGKIFFHATGPDKIPRLKKWLV